MKVLHYADCASLSWKIPYIAHMKAMAGLGVEQTLLCRSGETLERLAKENGIPVWTWKPLTAAVPQFSPGFVSVVKEIAPNIIHTRLLSAAGIVGTWRSRLGIPIVTTFDKPGKAKYYKNIDRYISCAGWLKDYMAEHEGLPAEKIEVVHNPADTARFSGQAAHRNESRALLHIEDDEILISGMGIYIPRKGFDVLLRAFGTLCKKHNNLIISVVVPAYNAEMLIATSLQAIIAQDYPNLEIIVVNDASTDGTEAAARRVLANCGRLFSVITNKKPRRNGFA